MGAIDQLRGAELIAALRQRYGAGPLHLISVVATLAIVAYAFTQIVQQPAPVSFLVYFGAAILAHDLIAFPLYSLLDRIAGRVPTGRLGPGVVNYVRVPALLSAFAFVVWFPLILGLSRERYEASAALTPPNYLARWLLVTAVLFAASGLVFALRLRRAHARDLPTDREGAHSRR